MYQMFSKESFLQKFSINHQNDLISEETIFDDAEDN